MMRDLLQPRGQEPSRIQKAANMISGAVFLIIVTATIWITANWDVAWKAVRFPEAVRQMQVEVLVKK